MIESLAGAIVLQAGDVVSLPSEIAARYIEHGIAEYVDKVEGVKPSTTPANRSRKATSKRKVEKR